MPVPRLPDEVIGYIIDHVPDVFALSRPPPEDEPENELALRVQLLACCLTSKAFLPRARAQLYDTVLLEFVIRDVAGQRPFDVVQTRRSSAQVLCIVLHPHLGRLVRTVDVEISIDTADVLDRNLPALVLATTLRAAPNVRALSTFVAQEGLYAPYLPPLYNTIPTMYPSLSTLAIHLYQETGADTTSPALFALLSSLPSLEVLTIRGLHVAPPILPSPLFPFQLRTLTLSESSGSSGIFDSLTANSTDTLTELRLDGSSKVNLAQFTTLRRLDFLLLFNLERFPNVENLAHAAEVAVRERVGPTLVTAPPCVKVLHIFDMFGWIPVTVFEEHFFGVTIPRRPTARDR
ncbi:hypothetical protein RQP46_005183 [Phenoliferia psychrophenolica]